MQWVIEQWHQHRGHLHRVVRHHLQLSARVGVVVGQPVRVQVSPLYFKWLIACLEISTVPPGHQIEVPDEGEQLAAGLRQMLLSIGGGGLRTGVHSPGQTGKRASHGGFYLWDAIICDHCSERSGRLVLLFLLRKVVAIDAVKGPNDGDEGANKAKSDQTCD
ncbi:hypothetical protein TYRP_006390 [Tyrophagus putrescentiae]|nr:hypothetical protein TYRP_006390 [Tyrophagus putrescentiae]